jgi:hypothetical protein
MKIYPPVTMRPRAEPRAIPLFHAVPARERCDGWTPLRQARFIGYLAETRSVSMAAQRVGMARESAYRLRRRPGAESFCAAWQAALGRPWRPRPNSTPPKVTPLELRWRVDMVWWRVRMDHGKFAGVSEKHDNSALLRLMKQISRGQGAAQRLAQAAKVT